MMIEIRLSGPLQITVDGEPVQGFRSQKGPALLAYLALERRPVARNYLASRLWPTLDKSGGRRELRRVLYDLKSHLPGCFSADRQIVQFTPDETVWLDVWEFSRLVELADAEGLATATTLYRGDLLEGLTLAECVEFDEWLARQREAWRQEVSGALERLVVLYRMQKQYRRALDTVRRLVALEPWREEAHRQLMALLTLQGRRAEALAQYKTCRRTLRQELNVPPAERTTALYERIRATGHPYCHNLPAQPTPFVGREKEQARLTSLLAEEDARLITIAGPGGSGKTRLALQGAAASLDRFLDAVAFVPLSSVDQPGQVAEKMVDVLARMGLIAPPSGKLTVEEHLLAQLKTREVLLLLDNFEHLLKAVPLLLQLLEAAPGVHLLVTSRTFLDVGWEFRLELAGLPYPPEEHVPNWESYPTVELFAQIARRVQPDFDLTPSVRRPLTQICRLVEGIPLAIELAAALLPMASPAAIAGDIMHNLDVLGGSRRDRPRRHSSVRASFDHSWRLLQPAEQAVLRRLSVFRGGFTLAAARAVSGNGPQALSRLLDRSLLSREEGDEGTPRYDIHHLIRQYLAEKLAAAGEAEATAEAHAAFFTRFLERQGTALRGREQKAAWQTLLAERDNVHAAWEWMLARGPAEMVEAALPALFHFYYMRNRFPSAVALFSAAVPILESRGQALRRPLGRLLGRLAAVRARMGRFSAAETAAGQALTIARELADRRGEAQALRLLGHLAYEKGQYSNAESLARQSLALFEELEDGHGQANCLNTLGAIAAVRASYSEADETHGWQSQIDTEWLQAAQTRLEKALALRQEAGDRWGESIVHHNLGYVTYVYGQHTGDEGYFREAHAQFLEAVTIDRTLDLPGPRRLNWLACTLGMLGDLKQAEQTFLQALTQAAEGHAWREVTDVLGNLARFIYLEDGRVEEASTLLTAVAAHPAADARVRLSAQEHLRARNHPVPPVSDAGPPALARIVDRVLAQ